MSVCTQVLPIPTLTFLWGSGLSETARHIKEIDDSDNNRLSETITFGWRKVLCGKAYEVYQEANADTSEPEYECVTKRTCDNILKIIKGLPDNILQPDVLADSDGSLLLDWFRDRENIFTVAVKDDQLAYATLYNGSKLRGMTIVSDEFPSELLIVLSKYFKK